MALSIKVADKNEARRCCFRFWIMKTVQKRPDTVWKKFVQTLQREKEEGRGDVSGSARGRTCRQAQGHGLPPDPDYCAPAVYPGLHTRADRPSRRRRKSGLRAAGHHLLSKSK